jgi:hypothetical protein
MTAADEIVRWGQHPLAFELATADAAVAARAREVFAPWPVDGTAQVAARFEVERIAAGACAAPDALPAWEARAATSGACARANTPDDALRWVELAAVQAFVPRCDGVIALHGALADVAGRGILVVGPPTAGKSSLACALWRAGAALLADDVALLELGTAEARPGPRRVALRLASRGMVGDDLWRRIVSARSSAPTDEGWCFHPSEIDGRPLPRATRIAAVIFLERPRRPVLGPAELSRIAPAHAVLAWIPYLVAQRAIEVGDAIRRIAPLATRVPAFDLARGALDTMALRARTALEEAP